MPADAPAAPVVGFVLPVPLPGAAALPAIPAPAPASAQIPDTTPTRIRVDFNIHRLLK